MFNRIIPRSIALLRQTAAIVALLALCSCNTLPKFSQTAKGLGGPANLELQVSEIVAQVQDEIQRSLVACGKENQVYVATAVLTLEVTNGQNFNLVPAYLDPLKAANTKFTVAGNAQLGGTQHRLFTETITLVCEIDELKKAQESAPKGARPDAAKGGSRLSGDLGIQDIVKAGIETERPRSFEDHGIHLVGVLKGDVTDKDTDNTFAKNTPPSFGTTIDFTITRNGGVGPMWTLIHFTGPSSSSSSLLGFSNILKDTLTLSFAKVPIDLTHKFTSATQEPEKKSLLVLAMEEEQKSSGRGLLAPTAKPGDNTEALGRAIKETQDNVQRMLLQRLIP
jgi:hypothetical protein